MKKLIGAIAVVLTLALSVLAMAGCTTAVKVKVIDINLTDEEYAFAVNKTDTATMTAANELIAELKANGKIAELIEKYSNGSEDKYFTYTNPAGEPDLATQFVIVTNAAFTPFEFKVGDKFTGVDIEIANMLAQKVGKPLFVKDGEFKSVVTTVNSGYAHIGMAGLSITDERKLSVDFSTPYFVASQVLIVKDADTTFDACKTKADIYAILNGLDKKVNIGFQSGTTGEFFTTSDYFEDASVVIKATGKGFANGALAVMKLQQKELDYVIIDKLPAQKIVAQMNKNVK